MGALNWLVLLLTRPLEAKALLQFWLFYEQKRDIKAIQEHPTSGWDRESMRKCWDFLDKTSRSFAAVIKELEGDLARTICLFYLVLRGLDTVEDDMTIPDHIKQPILRAFHKHTVTDGWSFDGCGPNEKDRQLLVEYSKVVTELNLVTPEYRAIIVDICQKMQTGMADYTHKAATSKAIYLETIAEYDLYCHYVAGLVGEGLSRLFTASGKESALVGTQLSLSNSMGLLLQKTNIIRDYREDCEDKRYFWPREIWGKYGFKEMHEMYAEDPSTKERAQWVQTHMVLDALRHTIDALDYLKLIKNQSVFNFVAIPATMAIATLELCFMNPTMFERNIKIRKSDAATLILRSTNPREVARIYIEYARKIHARVKPSDPNYLNICIACSRIEQWSEINYPSFVFMEREQGLDKTDPRAQIISEVEGKLMQLKRFGELKGPKGSLPGRRVAQTASQSELLLYVAGSFGLVMAIMGTFVWAVLQYTGPQ